MNGIITGGSRKIQLSVYKSNFTLENSELQDIMYIISRTPDLNGKRKSTTITTLVLIVLLHQMLVMSCRMETLLAEGISF